MASPDEVVDVLVEASVETGTNFQAAGEGGQAADLGDVLMDGLRLQHGQEELQILRINILLPVEALNSGKVQVVVEDYLSLEKEVSMRKMDEEKNTCLCSSDSKCSSRVLWSLEPPMMYSVSPSGLCVFTIALSQILCKI